MAAPKSGSKTRSKWQRIIAAGEASGLTAAEYCKRNGINPKYYSLWKGKLRDSGEEFASADGGKRAPATGKARKTATAKTIARSKKPTATRPVLRSEAEAKSPNNKETYSVVATLPNGLEVEIKCPGEAELSLVLQHLASL